MFELVPLWMALVFGVVAAIIIESFFLCREYSETKYYKDLAAKRMAEIADVRLANTELRHKVDELIDNNRDSLDKLDVYREQDGRMSASINQMLETIARYRNELRDAHVKIDELSEMQISLRDAGIKHIAAIEKITNERNDLQELMRKETRELKAQVQMHRTNAAKAQDSLHSSHLQLDVLDGLVNDIRSTIAEQASSISHRIHETKVQYGLNSPALASVDSGLAGAGPVGGNAESGPSHNAESPQVSS